MNSNPGGRPPIGGRLVKLNLTAAQVRAVEALVNLTGASQAQVLRDLIDVGLAAGAVRAGRWTYGPVGSDGTRFKWPDGYFDLAGEEAQKYLDE